MMKKEIVLVGMLVISFLIFIPTVEAGEEHTYTLVFDTISYGYVENQNDVYTQNNDWIEFGFQSGITTRGFVEFDISLIPDYAHILGVGFEFVSQGHTMNNDIDQTKIYELTIKPSDSTPEQIWNNCESGIVYLKSSFPGNYPGTPLQVNESLESGGWNWETSPANTLQNYLDDNYFAFLFNRYSDGASWGYIDAPLRLWVKYDFVLDTPTLVSPNDNTYIDNHNPTLNWNPVSGSNIVYQLQYGEVIDAWDTDIETTLTTIDTNYYDYESTIYWRIKAREDIPINPGFSAWSEIRIVHIENQSEISKPIPTFPSNGQNFLIPQSLIEWEPSNGNNLVYKYEYSEDNITWVSDVTTNTYANLNNVNYYDTIYWKVQAYENKPRGRTSQWSDVYTFTINPDELPNVAQLSPPNGIVYGDPTIVKLEWTSITGNNVVYDLEYKVNGILNTATPTNTFYDVSLDWFDEIEWRIKAHESSSPFRDTAWTGWWSFSNIPNPIDNPYLISPIDGYIFNESLSTNLEWSSVDGNGIQYEYEINGIVYTTTNTMISFDMDYFNTYEWRVRATETLNPYRVSGWTDYWNFNMTPDDLFTPILITPSNGSNVSGYVSMEWLGYSDSYEIHYSQNPDAENGEVFHSSTNLTGFYIIDKGLVIGDTIYWKVRTQKWLDPIWIYSNWSEVWSFTVGEENTQPENPMNVTAPLLISPENNSFINNSNITLKWTAIDNAIHYRYEYTTVLDNLFDDRTGPYTSNNYLEFDFDAIGYQVGWSVFWHVRAENNTHISNWSGWRVFTIGEYVEPEPPVNETNTTEPIYPDVYVDAYFNVPDTVIVGDEFIVEFNIDSNAYPLTGFTIRQLVWDANILELMNVSFGEAWLSDMQDYGNLEQGNLTYVMCINLDGVRGDNVALHLKFKALKVGTTPLEIPSQIDFGNAIGQPGLIVGTGNPVRWDNDSIIVSWNNSIIVVEPLPEEPPNNNPPDNPPADDPPINPPPKIPPLNEGEDNTNFETVNESSPSFPSNNTTSVIDNSSVEYNNTGEVNNTDTEEDSHNNKDNTSDDNVDPFLLINTESETGTAVYHWNALLYLIAMVTVLLLLVGVSKRKSISNFWFKFKKKLKR